MAKQINTRITGTIGDIIFYESKGEYLWRTKGKTGVQAPAAKKQASLMGKASAISGKLRAALKPILPEPGNRKIMYSLNNALQQWLRNGEQVTTEPLDNIPGLSGFSFYNQVDADMGFRVTMPVSRTADGQISLRLPQFDSPNPIHPLPFSGVIQLHIMAVSCHVEDPSLTTSCEEILTIPYYGNPIAAQEILLPLKTMPGNLTVVAISVNAMSAGIVGALYN
ncbi:MAG TPA: hypothetical protein PLC48_01035 [Ferruginibacter sp.]|nr:hypothetical protein [Ferruginibacter sp.]